jgi:hypothetical protein
VLTPNKPLAPRRHPSLPFSWLDAAIAQRPSDPPARWSKTVGYAGVEHQGTLLQAEIGEMSDGRYAARVRLAGGRFRIYDADTMKLSAAQARDFKAVQARVRQLIHPSTRAISQPMVTVLHPTATPKWDLLDASATMRSVMDRIRSKMMPGTGLWLRTFDRSTLSTAFERFAKAQTGLRQAIHQQKRAPNTPQVRDKLEAATIEAVLATNQYIRAGGIGFEQAARREVTELADLVRALSIVVGTAAGGPLLGGSVATGTRVFDITTPGPRMYRSSGVADVANILFTAGAMRAGEWAHKLAGGVGPRIAPWIGKLPPKIQVPLTHKLTKATGTISLATVLHLLSDTVAETGGRVAQDTLDGRSKTEIQRNARAAFLGSGLMSLFSSVTVEILEHTTKIPAGTLVAWSESLERLLTKLGVYVSVAQNNRKQPEAAKARAAVNGGSSNMTLFDLLYLEAKHRAPLFGDVPGLQFLRKLQSAAVRVQDAGKGQALPPTGVLSNQQDVTLALWTVLGSMKTDAEKKRFMTHIGLAKSEK